jgi:hypothetical protein
MSIQNVIHDVSSSTGQVARSPSNSSPSQQTLSNGDGQNLEEQEEDELDTSIDTGDDEERRDNDPFVEQDLGELKKLECMAMEPGRHGLSTRNLVGQIAVSGQAAPDLNNEPHIWFAFSILSVRTEGFFKIRFCLTDIKRIPV